MPPCYKICTLLIECVSTHWPGWVTTALLIMSCFSLSLQYFYAHIFLHILLNILSSILVHEFIFEMSFSSERMGWWFRRKLWILHFEVWCNICMLSNLSSWVHWYFMDCGDWLPNVLVGKWWRCCLTFKLYLGHKGSSMCSLESDLNMKMRGKTGRKVRLR